MKNLYPRCKTIMILLFVLCVTSISYSQQARPGSPIGGIVVKGGKNPGGNMLLNLNGGFCIPGKDLKEMNHLGNGFSFNANLYVPVFEPTEQSTLGFNAGFGMLGFKNESPSISSTGFKISGQSAQPELSYFDDSKNNRNGFTAEGGVQANFSFDKIAVSPILNLGYIRIKGSSQTVTQSSSVNGQNYSSEIYSRKTEDIENFMFIPKLRISYFPGKVGFFAEASYLTGGKANTTASMFQPNGAPNQEGFYSIDQIKAGKTVSQTSSSTVSSFGILIGVSVPLGKSISSKGVKRSERLSMTSTTSKQTQGSTFGEKVASGLQSKGGAIGQGASLLGGAMGKVANGTSSYWNSKEKFVNWKANSEIVQQIGTARNTEELEKIKTDFLNHLFVTKNDIAELKPELFKEIQASDDLKKRKISITKDGTSYLYLGNHDDLAAVISIPSNPTAIVQQCTNCTTSTCDGKTYTDCTCVNGFCMCLLCPEITKLKPLERIIEDNQRNKTKPKEQPGSIRNGPGSKDIIKTPV